MSIMFFIGKPRCFTNYQDFPVSYEIGQINVSGVYKCHPAVDGLHILKIPLLDSLGLLRKACGLTLEAVVGLEDDSTTDCRISGYCFQTTL